MHTLLASVAKLRIYSYHPGVWDETRGKALFIFFPHVLSLKTSQVSGG